MWSEPNTQMQAGCTSWMKEMFWYTESAVPSYQRFPILICAGIGSMKQPGMPLTFHPFLRCM